MPNTVRILRSTTAGATPSSLVSGQIAINEADGKLFYRNGSGVVTQLATGGGGSTEIYEYATTASFPGTGAAATIYIDQSSNRLYRWSGSAYIEVGPPADSRWSLFLPPAPTTVTAAQRSQSALVSWTATVMAPLVTDYAVQYSSDSGSTWTLFSDGTSTATSATVTGLTNGTAYTFRVAAVNGIGQGDWSSASASVTPAVGDAYFANVTLLLRMDGTGASFTDSSGTPKTITAGGNATQSATQSKFGGKSLYCDGTGDYISAPSMSLSSDFTAEAWIRWNGGVVRDYSAIFLGSSSNTQFFLTTKQNRTGLRFGLTGVAEYGTGSFTWVANTWYHVALVRASNAIRLYVNGSNVTDSSPTTSQSFSGELRIGGDGATTYDSNIFIDDVRVTTVARYSGASFSVPTAQFPDYG